MLGRRALTVMLISFFIAALFSLGVVPASIHGFSIDWLVIILIYWALVAPEKVGVFFAWIIGLLLDIFQFSIIGMHAIALLLIIYLVTKFYLRIRLFNIFQQAGLVFFLLLLYHTAVFWIGSTLGVISVGIFPWKTIIASTVCWPIICYILELASRATERY